MQWLDLIHQCACCAHFIALSAARRPWQKRTHVTTIAASVINAHKKSKGFVVLYLFFAHNKMCFADWLKS